MRKVTLLIGALALVLGISQCNKQDSPLQNGGKQHIVLTTGNDGSKVAVTPPTSVLNFTWEEGDVITVSGGAKGTLHLTSAPGQSTATFEGDVEDVTGEPLVFSVGNEPTSETYMNQVGTKEALEGILYFKTENEYQENGNYGNVQLPLTFAVVNIDLSKFASSKSEGATVTFSEKDTRGEPIASVTGVNASSTAVLVALPTDASPQEKVYELSNGTVVDYMTCTLNPDVYYSGNDNGDPIQPNPEPIVPGGGDTPGGGGGDEPTLRVAPDGALPYKFTVNEAGDYVFFAKGNLWCDASDIDNPVWHFEENQYGVNKKYELSHVSHFYCTQSYVNAIAANWVESDAATESNDGIFANHITISDEGVASDGWFVTSNKSGAEIQYIIRYRQMTNPDIPTYEVRTIDGHVGACIYPDDYSGGRNEASFEDLETNGVVFLPLTGGERYQGSWINDKTYIDGEGKPHYEHGAYQSSFVKLYPTVPQYNSQYGFKFNETTTGVIAPLTTQQTFTASAIRLVHPGLDPTTK